MSATSFDPRRSRWIPWAFAAGMLGVWAADRLEVPLMVTWHTDFEAYADHYALLTPFLDAYYRLIKASAHGMKRPATPLALLAIAVFAFAASAYGQAPPPRRWFTSWPRARSKAVSSFAPT